MTLSTDPDLEAIIAVQAAVIVELRAANARLVAANGALEARVGELERRLGKDSSNSSKPPSSDGLRKPARAERRDAEQAEGRRPGKQPGAPGAHLAQVEEPDEVVKHAPDRCGTCGADLPDAAVVGTEARQVFDLPRLRLWVTEHRAERRRCGCGTTTAAAFPDYVRAAACYGPGVRALVCYLCVHQHLPIDRAGQLLGDVLGANVATGTLAAVVTEGAARLDGFLEAVRAQLAAAPVAHFDETGARVAGRLHWVHSASTGLLSLFTVHAKRGQQAMDAAGVLPRFAGVAVHDGWSPYWRYEVTHALCGAHLLRELDGIVGEPGQGWAAGLFGAAGHVLDGLVDPLATFDVLEIQPAPEDAVVADPEDGDASHVEARPIGAGAVPVPLGPPGVASVRLAEQLGPEVGHAGKDLRPVAADLLASYKRPVGMHWLLAAIHRVEAVHEGVQVVTVLGVAETLNHLSHQALTSQDVSSLAMRPYDRPVELAAKGPSGTQTIDGAVVGPRASGQQRSTTVPSGQADLQLVSCYRP